MKFIDKTNWVMSEHGVPDSRLTVIRRIEDYVDHKGKHYAQWECKCSCEEHNIVVARGSDLSSGRVKSCGCLKHEKSKINGLNNKKINEYYVVENIVYGKASNSDNEFCFDLDDYDVVKDYCWFTVVQNGMLKIATIEPKTKKFMFMHQLLGCKHYDHIDHNELNNCRNNLRPATISQNNQNHSIRKDNTSGVSGVSFDGVNNRWVAYINENGKRKYVYSSIDKEKAIKARLLAEKEYYGEFAPQKHMFYEYGIE